MFFARKLRAAGTMVILVPLMALPASALAAKPPSGGGGSGSCGSKSDKTAPTVSIASPASGTTYITAQTVTITASASDNVGIAKVEFYRNGALQSTDTTAPFSHAWSITSATNGSHSWTAKAYDCSANNNSATSSAVNLTVNISAGDTTAPSTAITTPISGTTYTSAQTVTVNASASDNVGVARVEFYRNSVLQSTDTTSPYTHAWSVSSSVNGNHSWTSKAFDAAGNNTSSSPISLTVNIGTTDTTAPTVSITSPASGTTYTTSQTVAINASASDNVGVSRVEFYKGGVLQSTDTTSPYSHAWSVSSSLNGSHSWTAKAFDAAGNNTTSAAISLNVSITSSAPTVSIASPLSGSLYSSATTVSINATATDDVGVSRVEFYKGGVLQSTDTTSPYSHAWSVSSTNNGTSSWTAKAFDAAGNSTTSSAVNVTVNISSTAGAHLWSRQFGGTAGTDTAAGRLTAIDPNGEVLVVSSVYGTVDFGAGAHTSTGGIVLAKYSANGQEVRWSRQWTRQSTAEFMPTGLVVNADGSAVVSGYFYGIVDFGGGVTMTGAGGYDMFLIKFSSAGNYQWSQRIGGTGSETPASLAKDGSGNLYLTGWIQGSVNLGGAALSSNGGSRDIFLAKYNSSGALVWQRNYGGTSTDQGVAVAVDTSGNPTISGFFQGSINFGDGTRTSVGLDDIFVASFFNDGVLVRSWREGGTGRDQGRAVGIDGGGNLVLAASFDGTATIAGQSLTSAGASDIALARYNSSGVSQWARRYGGSYTDLVNGLAVNAAGDIAITGTFISWISLSVDHFGGDGSVDVFIAKYTSSGAHRWSMTAGESWDDYGNGVAMDASSGEVVVTGSFYSGIDLGGGLLSTTTGSTDAFLARYAP
jgi:hypothetical protein